MVYYFISILLLLNVLMRKGPDRQIATFIAILSILVIGGLRYKVGTDWDSYLDLYDSIGKGYDVDEYREESGFLLLVAAFKYIGASFSLFIFSIFALSFSIKVIAINRLKADLPVALCVYFYSIFLIYDVNGLRQGLAMAFIFLASTYAIRNQWLKFLALIGIATAIHTAAIIGLSLYLLSKFDWLGRQKIAIKLLTLVLLTATGLIISQILGGTDMAKGLEAVQAISKYSYYFDNDDYQEVFNFFSFATMQRLFVFLLLVLSYDRIKADTKEKSALLNIYAFSVFLYFLLSFNMEIMARASFYFKGFDIFIIGLIYASSRNMRERLFLFSILAIFTIGSIYRLLSIPNGMLIPYNSIISAA